ncbi:hypothetical protein HMPREF3171_11170 [Corynebacterium sp. HMSC08F01]|uniref:hypothetical protein n=1 Tax=Corynebacterium sp. HMSC08F01 TaxID=1581139 RepID=UPI0008A2D468|nr:hypothetical protein [Corynebacterium sp. HMSC08F01]OFT27566.1 hypothetical protein HMPREF3171_11170 [Corynebacterium sp. HMSC08F01]
MVNASKTQRPAVAKVLGASIGIPIIIGLMLFAFLAPTFASGPKDVPIAIAAPEPMVSQLEQTMGEDGPDITVYGSGEEVRDAVLNREVVGGLSIAPTGATAYTAAGNGAPYAQMIEGMASKMEAQGVEVTREELAPTSQDDPQATGLAVLGLPLAFGGIISAVIATFLFRGNKWAKLAVLTGIAAVGSLVVTWMLHSVYGTLTGNFALEWLGIGCGILATSMLTAGLAAIIGIPGVGIGAILTIFLANPLSGLATGPWLLPAGWSTLGQWMSVGATGHLIRSVSFFDGLGAGASWWVLAIWIAVGFVLLMLDRSSARN